MSKIIWICLAFLAGAFLPVQVALNSKLGKAAESPLFAALLSFLVGTGALALYVLLSRQTISMSGLKAAPAHAWIGGLIGAFYITVSILGFPVLGPGLMFGLIVAGQMILSALLEHYHILVPIHQPMNLMRALGITLVIGGVIIIRKF